MDHEHAPSQARNATAKHRPSERITARLNLRDATALILVLLTWAMLIAAVVR